MIQGTSYQVSLWINSAWCSQISRDSFPTIYADAFRPCMPSVSHWSCYWRYSQQSRNRKVHMWWSFSHWYYLLEYIPIHIHHSLSLSPFFLYTPSHDCNPSFYFIPSNHHSKKLLCICLNFLFLILWSKYFTFTIYIYSTRRPFLPLFIMSLSWSIWEHIRQLFAL